MPRKTPSPASRHFGFAALSAASRSQPNSAATSVKQVSCGQSCSQTWPVAVASPFLSTFFRRKASGSIPMARAARSIIDSVANSVSAAPKPRVAPVKGLFV